MGNVGFLNAYLNDNNVAHIASKVNTSNLHDRNWCKIEIDHDLKPDFKYGH